MYTYPNLSSILSSLSSLTFSELKVLQENIDAIITKKNQISNKENIEVNYMSDNCLKNLERISKVSASVHGTIPSQENVNCIYRSFLNHIPTDNLGLFVEQLIKENSLKLERLEQFKNAANQKSSSPQKPDRPLGVWKGKVRMSDDFNELSSDILSEFGIEE